MGFLNWKRQLRPPDLEVAQRASAEAGETAGEGPRGAHDKDREDAASESTVSLRSSGVPAWKRRVDATDYLEWREQVDPFRERPGVFFKALSLVVREWWVPRTELVTEVLAGIAGGLSVIPEVVAFALVAGVAPQRSIQTSMIICGIVTVFGGRPGMVSAAAGVVAIIAKGLVSFYGIGHLFYAVILMGIFQLAIFVLRGGQFVHLIPHTVMQGAFNGLSLVIAFAQVKAFKAGQEVHELTCPSPSSTPAPGRHLSNIQVFEHGGWLTGSQPLWMLLEVAVTIGVIVGMGFVKNQYVQAIPRSLMGIVACIVVEFGIVRNAGGRTKSIQDIAQATGKLPQWTWSLCGLPAFDTTLLSRIWLPALSMAVSGLLETVLTQAMVDGVTQWHTSPSREIFAQGLANVVAGCLGGTGGAAMIGETMVVLQSGGYRRLATLAIFGLLLIINTAAYPAINVIPISALVGVMWVVCARTIDLRALRVAFTSFLPARLRRAWGFASDHKVRRMDALVLLAVTVLTVVLDNLFIAVAVGLVATALAFAWDASSTLHLAAVTDTVDDRGRPRRVYEIQGPLFFGSARRFLDFFDPRGGPGDAEVHCQEMSIMDYSGLEAIANLGAQYLEAGKRVHVRYLRPKCLHMARKAKGVAQAVVVEQFDDAFVEEVERGIGGEGTAGGASGGGQESWRVQVEPSRHSIDIAAHRPEAEWEGFHA